MALTNVENKQQRKELEAKIVELDYNEAESLDKLKTYIARSQEQEKHLPETIVSKNYNLSNYLSSLVNDWEFKKKGVINKMNVNTLIINSLDINISNIH